MFNFLRLLMNNRGEVDPKTKEPDTKLLTQDEVDRIVTQRLAREKDKYHDYDDLKKFKTEHEQLLTEQQQKELEDKKQFDQAKQNYEKQINDFKGLISKKDQDIMDRDISFSLTQAIVGQGAFLEESLALLKPKAKLIDGNVVIALKDANNIDTQFSVEAGVKKFLESRPHLVKSTARAGGDTGGTGTTGGTSGQGTDDLVGLTSQFQTALSSGNMKLANELKAKLQKHPNMLRRGRIGI